MNSTTRTTLAASMITAVGLLAGQAQGAAVVHEDFDNAGAGDVAAQGFGPAGTGLDGNWSANFGGTSFIKVQNGTMDTGDLASAGGEYAARNFSGGFEIWNTSAALGGSGLLADGEELWFSYVFQTTGFSAGGWGGFALGNGTMDTTSNGMRTESATQALGVTLQVGTRLYASHWTAGDGTSPTVSGTFAGVADATPTLVVGKIEWGANAGANDTLTIYTPALDDLGTLGTGHSISVNIADQSSFTTLTVSSRDVNSNNGGYNFYDEIRIGASYEDVTPAVPEPTSLALLGLGGLLVARRRRG